MLVRELHRGGTRGSEYAYVLIGDELVHVSEVGRLVRRDADEYVYELPSNASSWVFIFSFSRSGYGGVTRCPPGGDINAMISSRQCESRLIEDAVNDWLGNVHFRVKSPELKGLLSELFGEFVVMASEVKNYWQSLGGKLAFMGHASRLREFFNAPRIYYFTELSIPSDVGRIRGIKITMSLIYENWVAVKIAEALGAKRLMRRSWEMNSLFVNEPVTVWFEQGGGTSFAILNTPYGEFTMWLEFQIHPAIHVFPNPESIEEGSMIVTPTGHGRRAVRPDIVVTRGRFDNVGELVKSGRGIDLLVECKALPYEDWRNDIDRQVIPYIKQFRPRKAILTTRHPVPGSAKVKLRNNGIEVVEDVRPGGTGNARLIDIVKDIAT